MRTYAFFCMHQDKTGVTGSIGAFDDSWKIRAHEARQNYYAVGAPTNQIMMSFKNQWEVYRRFLGAAQALGPRSLEPGSGRGSISCYFAAAGFDAYLLDTSAEILRVAEDIFRENGLSARFVCADCLAMPFPDGFFDTVVHCGLLEHFEDYRAPLVEQWRVLKPGGVIIATIVPEKRSVQTLFSFVNRGLAAVHRVLARIGMVRSVGKEEKKSLYRSSHGSSPYVAALTALGARIEYQGGIFPVPSFSYSPAFPFTLMPRPIERALVFLWSGVLVLRRLLWPRRHPWMCSEKWGQHVLVVARKPLSV